MSTKKAICELLSPAGSFDAARAAVNAGADAIYMGGPLFSARAYAKSSEEEQLLKSIEFCRIRDVRVFMTLNTLIKEREFEKLEGYIRPYYNAGLDGIIVQDLGVMRFIKHEFPKLELHVSTQAAVTGPHYAGLLKKAGASRIVLARELSLEEIRHIYEETGAELEVFAHGALCYSLSGQCLMSSFIGGRSGNRGRCAGPCRLPFEVIRKEGNTAVLNNKNEQYVLSMKDLCTAERLKEMLDAGVYSFKIEGRMKSPLYVAAVTSVYRKYLNVAMGKKTEAYTVEDSDYRLLSEAFERGGYTDGYLNHKNGRDMITLYEKNKLKVHDESIMETLKEKYLDNDKKIPVSGYILIRTGAVPVFRLKCKHEEGESEVTVYGEVRVTEAQKKPVTKEDIKERLGKFGGTDFELVNLTIETDEEDNKKEVSEAKKGWFLPLSSLNELRRRAVEELIIKILS